jgi:cyclic-di-GMP-binding protein
VAPLTFQEARGCKDWLNALPLTNIPQAQAQVLEVLRGLNSGEFNALERLKCLELMRDKIAFLQGEQRARYFGKSLPLSPNDEAAWSTGLALLAEMETGYRGAASGLSGELAAHRALCEQRIARYLGAQMLFHAAVYRRFDPGLWRRLHGLYRGAEEAGIAAEGVKDSLEAPAGSSIAEAYLHIVMLQAAYLSELSANHIDYVEALLRMWLRKVTLQASAPNAAAAHVLAVDLAAEIGARPLAPAELTPSHRVLDVSGVSASLRKRIHGLRHDEEPGALGLPPELGAVATLHLLQRLHRLWCEGRPPRPPARIPEEKTAGFAMGLPEIWFFVSGGKAFEEPGKTRELTSQEKQDIEVFGRISERTQGKMAPMQSFTPESWGIVDEMLGAWRLQRPGTSSRSVSIGRLVAFRAGDAGTFFIGVVSALVQETDGRVVITATLFPGKPEALAARAVSGAGQRPGKWCEAFRLPALERIRVQPSLVVGSGIVGRGRPMEVWDRDEARELATGEILERGADFDRVALA